MRHKWITVKTEDLFLTHSNEKERKGVVIQIFVRFFNILMLAFKKIIRLICVADVLLANVQVHGSSMMKYIDKLLPNRNIRYNGNNRFLNMCSCDISGKHTER